MAMARNPPSPLIRVTVASSISEMQSQRMLPSGVHNEQRALPDGELWLRADADEAWLVLAEPVVVRNPEPFQRCPRLPLGQNVLALIFAHRALSRRGFTWRILRTAGRADERRHDLSPFGRQQHALASTIPITGARKKYIIGAFV